MTENTVEVKNVKKEFNNTIAVDNISFTIKTGEIVGLLGPNGAGKTTTLHMLLGLVEPTSGEIFIFGKDFRKRDTETLLQMNFAATYAQLPGNLKVKENLLVYAMLYGIQNARKRVREILKEFSLEDIAHKKTGFLSSGEQSRLVLAKAFLNQPKLLLLDEPIALIDPHISESLRSQILSYVKETNGSILWTSHDMYEIEKVCTRVLFISHGKIFLEGDPKKLPEKYNKKNLEDLFISIAEEPLREN